MKSLFRFLCAFALVSLVADAAGAQCAGRGKIFNGRARIFQRQGGQGLFPGRAAQSCGPGGCAVAAYQPPVIAQASQVVPRPSVAAIHAAMADQQRPAVMTAR